MATRASASGRKLHSPKRQTPLFGDARGTKEHGGNVFEPVSQEGKKTLAVPG
jgi:hypothetical protein